MKIAVVCANFGDYDEVYSNPNLIDKEKFNWYLFTDNNNLNSDFWTVVTNDNYLSNVIEGKNDFKELKENSQTWNMMAAKYYKLQTHKLSFLKDYDYFVWIDSSISILNNNFVNDLLEMLNNGDIELINFIHPERDNIIDEGNLSIRMDKYQNQDILKQVDNYTSLGFNEKGLFWCGFFCRKNNIKMNKIFDDWWIENIQKSFQDQLSYPYVLWKNNKKPDLIIHQSMYYNQFLGKVNYPHKVHRK